MTKKDMDLIVDALQEARSLISEEYQALLDEELRHRYDEVLGKVERAIKQIGKSV
ncbi:MAG: hypothetical protein NTX01_08650 [Candidatus Omnitrophica bacterium]|nr:hypothetical protein [Candidatus Omnitrophota bacterium]